MARKFVGLLIDNTNVVDTKCIDCIYSMFLKNDPANIVDCYCPFPSSYDVFKCRVDGEDCACPFFILSPNTINMGD